MPEPTDWNEVNWSELYPRLLLVAARKLKRLNWNFEKSAADFVQESIRKTISQIRPWNHRTVTLYAHLCGVISSEISNAVNSMDNKFVESSSNIVDFFPLSSEDSPEQFIINKDLKKHFLEILRNKDIELYRFAKHEIFQDEYTGQVLSKKDIRTSKDIDNLRKRLRRAIDLFNKTSGKILMRESDGGPSE
jgi:hypothetical protein